MEVFEDWAILPRLDGETSESRGSLLFPSVVEHPPKQRWILVGLMILLKIFLLTLVFNFTCLISEITCLQYIEHYKTNLRSIAEIVLNNVLSILETILSIFCVTGFVPMDLVVAHLKRASMRHRRLEIQDLQYAKIYRTIGKCKEKISWIYLFKLLNKSMYH